jgi:hypothetical protein
VGKVGVINVNMCKDGKEGEDLGRMILSIGKFSWFKRKNKSMS